MLDNDELVATRKLHRIDDGLYEETSDKNVANIEDTKEYKINLSKKQSIKKPQKNLNRWKLSTHIPSGQ